MNKCNSCRIEGTHEIIRTVSSVRRRQYYCYYHAHSIFNVYREGDLKEGEVITHANIDYEFVKVHKKKQYEPKRLNL